MPAPKSNKGTSSARSPRSNAIAGNSKRSAPDSASEEVASRAKKPRTNSKKEARTTRSGKRLEDSDEAEDEEDVDMINDEEEEQNQSASARGRRKPPTSRPPASKPSISTSASAPVKSGAGDDIWSKLKAETLRSVVRDIGEGSATTKDAMISQLQAIQGTAHAEDAWSQLKAPTLRSVLKDVGEVGATSKEAMASQFQAILGGAGAVKQVDESDDDLPYMTASASALPRTKSPFRSKSASTRSKTQSRPSATATQDEQAEGPSIKSTRSASRKLAPKPAAISKGRKRQREEEKVDSEVQDDDDVSAAEEAERDEGEEDEEEEEPPAARSSARSRAKPAEARTTRSSGISVQKPAPKAAKPLPSASARKRRREEAPTSDEDEGVGEDDVGLEADLAHDDDEEEEESEVPLTRSSVRTSSKRARASSERAKSSSKRAQSSARRASKRIKPSGGNSPKAPNPSPSPPVDDQEEVASGEGEKLAGDEEEKRISDEGEKVASDEEEELISDEEEAMGPRKRRTSTRASASTSAKTESPARRQAKAKADAVEAEINANANRSARENPKARGGSDQDDEGETADDAPASTFNTFEPEPESGGISTPASSAHVSPPPRPSLDDPIPIPEQEGTQSASTQTQGVETPSDLPSFSPVGEDAIASSSSLSNDVKASTRPRGRSSTRSKGKQAEKLVNIDLKGKGKAKAVIESDDESDVADGEPELVDLGEHGATSTSPGAWRREVLDPILSRKSRTKSPMKPDVQVALCDDGYSSDEEPVYGYDNAASHDSKEGTGAQPINDHPGFRLNFPTQRPLGQPVGIHCFVFEDSESMRSATLSAAKTKKKKTAQAKARPSSSAWVDGIFVDLPTITTIDDEVPPTVSASGRIQRKRTLSPKKAEALAHAAEVEAMMANARASQGSRKRGPRKTPKHASAVPATGVPDESDADAEGDPDDSYLLAGAEDQAPVLASPGQGVERVGPPRSSSHKALPESRFKPESGSLTPQVNVRPLSSRQQDTEVLDHVKIPKRVRRSRPGVGTGTSTPTSQLGEDLDADGSDLDEGGSAQQPGEEAVEQLGPSDMSTIGQTITVETTTTEVIEQQDGNELETMAEPHPFPVITETTSVTTVETIQDLGDDLTVPPSSAVDHADMMPETSAPAPASDAPPLQAPVPVQQTTQSPVHSLASQAELHQSSPVPRGSTPVPTASEGPELVQPVDRESQQPTGSPVIDFPQGEMIIETTTTEITTTVTEETPADPSLLEDTLPRVESTRSWESVVLERSPSSPTAAGQLPGVGDPDIGGLEAGTGLTLGNPDAGAVNELLNVDSSLVPSNLDADVVMNNAEDTEFLLTQEVNSMLHTMEANAAANGAEAVSSSPRTHKVASLSPKADTLPARLFQTSSSDEMPAESHSAIIATDGLMLDTTLAENTHDETAENHNVIVDESLSLPDPMPSTSSAVPEITESTNAEPAFGGKTPDAGPIIDEYTTLADPVPSTSSKPLQMGAVSPGRESNGVSLYDADPYTQHLYDLKNGATTPHSPHHRANAAELSSARELQASPMILHGSAPSTSRPTSQATPQRTSSDKSPPSQWGHRPVD